MSEPTDPQWGEPGHVDEEGFVCLGSLEDLGITAQPICRTCSVPLDDTNWAPSFKMRANCECKGCRSTYGKAYYQKLKGAAGKPLPTPTPKPLARPHGPLEVALEIVALMSEGPARDAGLQKVLDAHLRTVSASAPSRSASLTATQLAHIVQQAQ